MNRRVVLAGVVVCLAAVAAVDVVWPAEPPTPEPAAIEPLGSIAACPIALAGRGRGWIHLANLGDTPARVRVTMLPSKGKRYQVDPVLPPRSARSISVHNRVKGGASALIEAGGADVVASHGVIMRSGGPGRPSGGGGAACGRAGPVEIVVPHARTLNASTTLALFNPGSADADVTVTLYADGRRLAPERLRRLVVSPRARREFRLGDFAFDTRDLTAVIRADAGRVVAEAMVESGAGVEIIEGVSAAAEVLTLADASGKGSVVSVVSVGDEEDTALAGRLMTPVSQGRAAVVPDTLEPGVGKRSGITGSGAPSAFIITRSLGSPIASAASWGVTTRRVRDRATIVGVVPSRRWGGAFGFPTKATVVRLLIANPGPMVADVTVSVLGEAPVRRRIGAGRVVVTRIKVGAEVVGVEVASGTPVGVALTATVSDGFAPSVAGLSAVRLDPADPVAVELRGRAGVPARLPVS